MKLKYKGLVNVSVFCKGQFYSFINGTIDVSEKEAEELLKNPNIEKIEIVEETVTEETVEEKKATGKKGKK